MPACTSVLFAAFGSVGNACTTNLKISAHMNKMTNSLRRQKTGSRKMQGLDPTLMQSLAFSA